MWGNGGDSDCAVRREQLIDAMTSLVARKLTTPIEWRHGTFTIAGRRVPDRDWMLCASRTVVRNLEALTQSDSLGGRETRHNVPPGAVQICPENDAAFPPFDEKGAREAV
jgi:hypothetical protein